MIRFGFTLFRFPRAIGTTGFDWSKSKLLTSHKAFEIQISRFPISELIDFQIDLHWWGSDHAGPELRLQVLGLYFAIQLYDTRHWNYEEGRWYHTGEQHDYQD